MNAANSLLLRRKREWQSWHEEQLTAVQRKLKTLTQALIVTISFALFVIFKLTSFALNLALAILKSERPVIETAPGQYKEVEEEYKHLYESNNPYLRK